MTALDSARTTRSLPRLANRRDEPRPGDGRPRVDGKLLAVGDQRLTLAASPTARSRPDDRGASTRPRPWSSRTSRRWRGRRQRGAGLHRAAARAARRCARRGLWVLVGLPWEQHVAFLDDARRARAIVAARAARRRAGAPDTPRCSATRSATRSRRAIVRWHGRRRVERFLDAAVAAIARRSRPGALVTYVSFPTTEYLRAAVPRLRRVQRLPRGRRSASPPTSPGCRTSPATGRWCSPSSGSTAARNGARRARRERSARSCARPSRSAAPARSCSRGPTSGTAAATR